MLAKFKNSKQIEKYRGYVIIDGTTYVNNEEKAREAGYKDLIIEEQPEFNPETEWLDNYYVDGEVITQKWEIKPIEPIEEVE